MYRKVQTETQLLIQDVCLTHQLDWTAVDLLMLTLLNFESALDKNRVNMKHQTAISLDLILHVWSMGSNLTGHLCWSWELTLSYACLTGTNVIKSLNKN